MKRYLRIAFSATCGIICVPLIALWLASYNTFATSEPIAIDRNTELTVELYHGQIAMVFSDPLPPGIIPAWLRDYPLQNRGKLPGVLVFAWHRSPIVGSVLTFPFWFATMLVVSAGVLGWFRYNFSLRTLLIAITLVGLILGTTIWLSQ